MVLRHRAAQADRKFAGCLAPTRTSRCHFGFVPSKMTFASSNPLTLTEVFTVTWRRVAPACMNPRAPSRRSRWAAPKGAFPCRLVQRPLTAVSVGRGSRINNLLRFGNDRFFGHFLKDRRAFT
jgi:hypothetical protein